jgi:outer membrane receptor protein involved in Fe transport
VLRVSGGRGQRTANILAENNGLLASAREVVIRGDGSDKPYGLDAEVAWNYGVNFTQEFYLNRQPGSFSVDFYRTHFENQIVTDMDQSARKVVFYNLDGKSYSNSVQVQTDYALIDRLDVRLAYRWFDVKTNFGEQLLQKPFVSAHRAFANLAYETPNGWKFDYTVNWQGSQRIPFTGDNPQVYQMPQRSPDFVVMNAQVTKSWDERFEVYVGVENLLNYRQQNPIIASSEPFSPYFDSAMVWGPIFGRNTYIGLRYRIK